MKVAGKRLASPTGRCHETFPRVNEETKREHVEG